MDLSEVKRRLREGGYTTHSEERLPNDLGWQLRVLSPEIINVFDTGNVNVQGKRPVGVEALLRDSDAASK